MLSAFESDRTYHTGEFKCDKCNHQTVIFIDTDYDMFGFGLMDKTCSICTTRNTDVSDADLIIRYDWPNADDNPWQLQGATLHDKDRYCIKCSPATVRNWKKFIVACSKCDGFMEFNK